MKNHTSYTLLGCLVLVLCFISGGDGAISRNVMKEVIGINKEGPYLGIVVPNNYEMSPLLQSPSFVGDAKKTVSLGTIRKRKGHCGIDWIRHGTSSNLHTFTPLPKMRLRSTIGAKLSTWLAVIGANFADLEIFADRDKIAPSIVTAPKVLKAVIFLNAGIATELLLTLFRVKGVVHYGIAGNANPDLQIGDVTIPHFWAHTGLWNWQDSLLNRVWYQPEEIFPVNGTPEIRQHSFWAPVDDYYFQLAERLEEMNLTRCVNSTTCLPRNPIATRVERGVSANIFVDNRAYREFLFSKFNATAIDMESAAISLVCIQHQKRFIAIRALSDLAGGGSSVSNEAATFASLAAQNAVDVVIKFIKLLS
ncbi:hypothetical protein RHGRI_009010 [Rhododendron griersonianum]|uniref:Nucleoside phosphorylase domain-containing protein n=1 Tax=Rhododendron griersonianum TaxID=479676 RepID=A0AAV6L3H4_9ERIC|nr:hypothetical protein RHGRI_009010 [Rhododendron griersonianum]